MGLPDRAQIGVYSDEDSEREPIIVITRHSYGHPTGAHGVVPELAEIIPAITEEMSGRWDGPTVAAVLIHHLVSRGYQGQYSIDESLHVDTRFYYAVRPEGVTVYDARPLESIVELVPEHEMFTTAWIEPERMRKVESEVRKLEDELSAKRLELEGMKRKQPKATK